jgi:hypothetical protein
LLVVAIALFGCKDEDQSTPRQREVSARRAADAALLKDDPTKASEEFLDRLHQDIQRGQGGLIYVNEPLIGTVHAFPPHVVWHLECGMTGIDVSFSGTAEPDNSGVDVELTDASISMDRCRELLPPLGSALVQIGGRLR